MYPGRKNISAPRHGRPRRGIPFSPKAAFRLNSDLRVCTSVPWVIQATRTSCHLSSEANDLLENLGLNNVLDQETSGASSTLPAPSVLRTDRHGLPGAPSLPTQTLCKDAGPASHRLCGKHSSEHLPGRAFLSRNRLSRERREQTVGPYSVHLT